MSRGANLPPIAGGPLLQSPEMVHPFDFVPGDLEMFGAELFAIDPPDLLDGRVEALSTDCGNTLSTILCDCVNTLSTLFCLSSSGCSG